MKRTSFGIILPGDPECVQEDRSWLSALTVLCSKGWIIALIIAVIMLIIAVFQNNGDMLESAIRPAWVALMLFLCSLLWNENRRCPYCRHFFTMSPISDEKCVDIRHENISRTAYDYHCGTIYDISGDITSFGVRSSHTEYGTKETKTLAVNKRCSCCGCVNKAKIIRIDKNY